MDLGLEQAGMKTVWQVEFDDWARERLAENFPHTEKYKDVREVGKHNLKSVDVICGGFPCQDISQSKHNAEGLDGKRSGLWFEMFRIIRELRPRYALIENVAKLLVFGASRVLSDLAAIGYDAEWQVIRAESFNLATVRPRLFIIAFPQSERLSRHKVFQRTMRSAGKPGEVQARQAYTYLEDIKRAVIEIPEHLRVDNGLSLELSEIERAVKGYGNAVAVPVAKWLGEQIIRFDREVRESSQHLPEQEFSCQLTGSARLNQSND